MKVCTFLLSTLVILNCNAQEPLSYTYVEGSVIEQEVEGISKEATGYRALASIQVNEISYVKMHYLKSTKDWHESSKYIELDVEDYYLGFGLFKSITATSDVYVELATERESIDFTKDSSIEDDTEFSYSATFGLRTVQFEYFEFEASVKHLYNQDGSEFSSKLGAFYDVSNSLAIGIEKEFGADIDTLAATVRYSF